MISSTIRFEQLMNVLKNLKKTTKSLINALRLEVYRLTPSSNACLQTCKSLSKFKIDLVFDIGANTGQFAKGNPILLL